MILDINPHNRSEPDFWFPSGSAGGCTIWNFQIDSQPWGSGRSSWNLEGLYWTHILMATTSRGEPVATWDKVCVEAGVWIECGRSRNWCLCHRLSVSCCILVELTAVLRNTYWKTASFANVPNSTHILILISHKMITLNKNVSAIWNICEACSFPICNTDFTQRCLSLCGVTKRRVEKSGDAVWTRGS